MILCYNQLEQRRQQTAVQNDGNEFATGCEAETQADQEIVTTENECLQSDLDNLPNDPAENPIHSNSFEDLSYQHGFPRRYTI